MICKFFSIVAVLLNINKCFIKFNLVKKEVGEAYIFVTILFTVPFPYQGDCSDLRYLLSSQNDEYKVTFPSSGEFCDCPSCNLETAQNCKLTFTADRFTLDSFELCLDISEQRINRSHCSSSHAYYKTGSSQSPNLIVSVLSMLMYYIFLGKL